MQPKSLNHRRSVQDEILEQLTSSIAHLDVLDIALPISAAILCGVSYRTPTGHPFDKWQLLQWINSFLSENLITKPTLFDRAKILPLSMAKNGDVYAHSRGSDEDYMLRVSSMSVLGPDITGEESILDIHSIQDRKEDRLSHAYRFFEVSTLAEVSWMPSFDRSLRGAIHRAQTHGIGLDPGYLRWLFHNYD